METAVIDGLSHRYTVLSGERVTQAARKIFARESSRHVVCDETRCMQDIATVFQSELIAVVSVTRHDGKYFLTLNIQNVFDNRAVTSLSVTCEGCSPSRVIERLRMLTGGKRQALGSGTGDEIVTPTTRVLTWHDARDQCREVGGKLPSVEALLDLHKSGAIPLGPPVWSATSTSVASHYMVGMVGGAVQSYDDAAHANVICVR
jgi:hypothetical protein